MKDMFDIHKWRRNALVEENRETENTVFTLLDTLQDEESVFTGVSKTRQGIEALKQYVIDLHNIQVPIEMSMLKIYEVPFDRYFKVRKDTDDVATAAFK